MAPPRRTVATTDAPELDVSYHTGGPREPRRLQVTPAWAAIALSTLAIFWTAASNWNAATLGASGRLSDVTRRVELLEAADRQRGDALSRIDARTARIEATLEFMRGGVGHPLSEPVTIPSQQGVAP